MNVGVGIRGASRMAMVRIGAAFAFAEVAMNVIGAGLGSVAGNAIGPGAGYLGFGALVLLGAYAIKESRNELSAASKLDLSRGWGLVVASLTISLDSLGVGFSILYIGVPLIEALAFIGIVSIAATALGLTLGRLVGARAEQRAAFLGGLLLILTGVTFIALKALHLG
ncbi:MAG: manganese efflux pump [Candidatus Eremiobacteraeota bacterium]|nr:manganese efflux pump [Candidatus Eremiobacteraeota bacterium]